MFGRKPPPAPEAVPVLSPSAPMTTVRVFTAAASVTRSLGRRNVDFSFDRAFVPSLVVDHTELILRQAGTCGDEGFVVWAGSLAGDDAYVSSIIVPKLSVGGAHSKVSAETTARLLEALDERDLVPIAQLHTHPRRAFLSDTDATRPIVAVPGFLSIIIPDFGFVNLTDTGTWSVHAFRGAGRWHELTADERGRRFIIDDSIIRVH
jgi:hypothetical protein